MAEQRRIFTPGIVVELADSTHLAEFEDAVALEVNPTINFHLWAGRVALKDLIRPAGFNGSIRNITLETMSEPAQRFQDSRERGWIIQKGCGNAGKGQSLTSLEEGSIVGFSFSAEPRSSRPGNLGLIQAELWYAAMPKSVMHKEDSTYPMRTYTRKAGSKMTYYWTPTSDHEVNNYGGTTHLGARRFVTKPKFNKDAIEANHDDARKIGIEVLREALSLPYHGGMVHPR